MIDPQFIGQLLLKKGFRVWFKYLFRVIEGRAFIEEPIHADLFQAMQDIYEQKITRCNINVPPRSAKTTMAKYFLAFCWTKNPKMNFIYTSYSASLLANIANEVMNILEHPVYKAMYPMNRMSIEEEDITPLNDFWYEYLKQYYKNQNIYTGKKIITYAGGMCLFSPIGGQLTGFGAAIRGAKGFTGGILIDDANKSSDIRSQVMREKVLRYYEETLLSRLNNPNAAIINIQQRLNLEDLTGFLDKKYHFTMIKKPLLDDNGICQIPSQYTEERIKELKQNNYMFQAQFQQEPIAANGNVIKRDWFRYYPVNQTFKYKRILIAADTAMKTKEYNDYSVFIAGGVTQDNHLHVLDMIRGKWEAPELEKNAVMFWNRFKRDKTTGLACNGLYIEDRVSGTYLIQGLKKKYGIPVIGVKPDADKLTRVEGILTFIESGMVYLPENEYYGFVPDLLAECEGFSRDMSQAHEDCVDAMVYLIQQALGKTEVSILDYFM